MTGATEAVLMNLFGTSNMRFSRRLLAFCLATLIAAAAHAAPTPLILGVGMFQPDKGSTSGYLISRHYFLTQGVLDAGADYNRNAMIEQGLIKAEQSRIIWQSEHLPNDALAVRQALFADAAFVAELRAALAGIGAALKNQPNLLPAHYTGFVTRDNTFYKPIRDAGLATGTLRPR